MRDDFAKRTIDILARQANYRCSNPNCRKPASGPQEDPAGTSHPISLVVWTTIPKPSVSSCNASISPPSLTARPSRTACSCRPAAGQRGVGPTRLAGD
jgi:hypothetical protein